MLQLKIYKPHSNEVEKIYEAEEAHVMYGTLQDIAEIINDDIFTKGKDRAVSIGKAVLKAIPVIDALLPDIFVGLTPEELKRVRTDELIQLIIDISMYTANELIAIGGEDEGN